MSDRKLDDLLRMLKPFEEISKAEATEELRRIAAYFVALLDGENAAARPPEVVDQLEAVAAAAAELRGRLERMSPAAWHLLAFRFLPDDPDYLPASSEEQFRDLAETPRDSGWPEKLADLERFARGAATSPAIPKDLGGPTNPLRSLVPRPKAQLAAEAWRLYDCCRPGEGSARRNGPLHSFAEKLLSFAVRERQDAKDIVREGETMYDHLRRFENGRKAMVEVEDELRSVLVALANCRQLGCDDPALEARSRVLENRLAELWVLSGCTTLD